MKAAIIKEFGLALYLLLSLRILLRTPFEKTLFIVEAGFELALVSGLAIYLIAKVFKKNISRFEAYLLLLCLVPFVGAFTANFFYHQPLIYGLLAQRSFFLCISALFLFHALKTGYINLRNVERALIGISWTCLLCYILVNLSVNPAPFKETGFVGYNSLKGGYLFRFNMTLIVFATFYYFISLLKSFNKLHALYFLLFFGYILLIRQDRTIVLTTLIGLAILIFKNTSFRRGFFSTSMIVAGLILVLGTTYFLNENFFNQIGQLYANSIHVVMNLGADEIVKGNGNVRISEAQIAADGFLASPFVGQGVLSKQFNGGFSSIYGHFYPADVGILGVLFLYGIIGVGMVFYQIILMFRYGYAIKKDQHILLMASLFFLIQFLLNSVTDGRVVLRSSVSLTFLALLYFNFYQQKQSSIAST